MIWKVEFHKDAEKELLKLNPEAQKKIIKFLKERISTHKNPKQFGKLLKKNLHGLWRYRVTKYRIICQIQDEKLIVLVLKIGHRKNIYS